MSYTIEVTRVPSRLVAVRRFHVRASELGDMGGRMGAAFGAVMARLGQAGVPPAGPAVACYERTDDGFDVAAGFPVNAPFDADGDVGQLVLPAAEVAHTTHVGSYDRLPAAYEALREAMEGQGLALAADAPMWEEYWSGPGAPPERTRTEVFWPVVAAA